MVELSMVQTNAKSTRGYVTIAYVTIMRIVAGSLARILHGTSFPGSVLVTCSRGCHEHATRKTVPWN